MAVLPDAKAVDLSDLLRATGVAKSTRANWVSKGVVQDRDDGRFSEDDVVDTAVAARFVEVLADLRDVGTIMREYATPLRVALTRAAPAAAPRVDALVAPRTLDIAIVSSDSELIAAIKAGEPVVLVELGDRVAEARRLFGRFAGRVDFDADRRRRARRRP